MFEDDELESLINQVPSAEDLVAEFLNEHSFDYKFDATNQEMIIEVTGPDIPALDPNCLFCETPLKKFGEAGWKHLNAARDIGFCQFPWPGEGLEFMNYE